ncbi:hypothetical protein Y1Q_0012460 [Alligator mississippiensis]|uniref:Uncharacterized protein n=1 Tax=Alligator mississippiensis TaxID=8496 RepID=A0A151M7R0_ALLMI|nr:hypothetical protein Y1Q_0012460 [Alligator mississippiensis]
MFEARRAHFLILPACSLPIEPDLHTTWKDSGFKVKGMHVQGAIGLVPFPRQRLFFCYSGDVYTLSLTGGCSP